MDLEGTAPSDVGAETVRVLRQAAKALALADLYLDGFVWVDEPEVSELRKIKRASKAAQAAIARIDGYEDEPLGLTYEEERARQAGYEPPAIDGGQADG